MMTTAAPQTNEQRGSTAKAKPPEPAKPPLPSIPEFDWSKPVPVAIVRFDRAVTYPGAQPTEYAKTTTAEQRVARPNGPTFDVEYLAPVRQFRITFTDVSRGIHKVGYVAECRNLGWEPVA
jgi:hypothetical protein